MLKTIIDSLRRRFGLHPMRRSTDSGDAFEGATSTQELANICTRGLLLRRHDDVDLLAQSRTAIEERAKAEARRVQPDLFDTLTQE